MHPLKIKYHVFKTNIAQRLAYLKFKIYLTFGINTSNKFGQNEGLILLRIMKKELKNDNRIIITTQSENLNKLDLLKTHNSLSKLDSKSYISFIVSQQKDNSKIVIGQNLESKIPKHTQESIEKEINKNLSNKGFLFAMNLGVKKVKKCLTQG